MGRSGSTLRGRNGMTGKRFFVGVLVVLALGPAAATARVRTPVIHVLSNRADLVSSGDALVSVDLPGRRNSQQVRRVRVYLNGHYIQRDFALRPNGRYEGLVTNLKLGSNLLRVRLPDGTTQRITITNHPHGGPVISGPQLEPWVCQSGALDAQCNQEPTYEYLYKSTSPTAQGLQTYDPNNPPADVADTTTDQGVTLPFIVRVETGYQDRDQYKIATLYRPGQEWQPWEPQDQWNHKLLITHGASC